MVDADLSRFAPSNCNIACGISNVLGYEDSEIIRFIDDSSGLPILKATINGVGCSILLDTGSKLNLVSQSFIKEKLNIDSQRIHPSNVLIKGVSGNVFQALGEIDLSFSLEQRNLQYRFVVLSKSSLPTDLLLSYTSCKSLCPTGSTNLSLLTSDFSLLLHEADVKMEEEMIGGETNSMECMGCCSGCEFCSMGEKSRESNTHVSVISEPVSKMCMNSVNVLQYLKGEDFLQYVQFEDCGVDLLSDLKDVVDVNVGESTGSVFNMSTVNEVGLVAVDDDNVLYATTTRDIVLVPDCLTRVDLRCEDVVNKEVLVVNDKFVLDDTEVDNALVKVDNGNFFVYARSNNGMSVNVYAGTKFCNIVPLCYETVALSREAFLCRDGDEDDETEKIKQELKVADSSESNEELIKLLLKYRSNVALTGDSLGRTTIMKHEISLEEGSVPFYVPNYRLPIGRRQAVDDLISDMKKEGVVSESKSPYNSPMLLVPKKDGSWRLVIDFRRLNSLTIPDRMPMPILDEVLHKLSGATVFSSLDLLSGYWQLPLEEASKPLTAFSTHKEHLQFEVMPFGLCNGPLSFVRLMREVLGDIPNVFCYIDDIVCFTKDEKSQLETLELVFEKLQKAGLKVKLKKCRFMAKELEFLGHTISADGIHMQDSKVKAIVDYPSPKNVKALRRFLGIIGYYRAFVEGYATIAFPLTSMLKANCDFKWGEEEQNAFAVLKGKLVKGPILTYPDFSKQFYVASDASNVGLGAVLLQKVDRKLMPISFASRVLNSAERNYSVTERELLAVVWALKKFRHTILGFPVQVITDHLPVVDLFKKRAFVQNSKFNRWFLYVLEFNPQFRYLPGKYNTIADGLSRLSEEEDSQEHRSCSFIVQNLDLDMTLVREEQERDMEVRQLMGKILSNDGVSSKYEILDGLLYLKPTKEGGCSRLFVPSKLRRRVLELVHSHRLAGHPGIAKTVRHVSRNFFWPGCRTLVQKFISECPTCQVHKGNPNRPAPLDVYPSQLLPFQMVSMDIVGPFPVTDEGFKYILVFSDYFSRYVEIVPIKNKSSVSVAEALRHRVITRHTCPRVLLSDNALEFTSEVIQSLCNLYGITKCQIVAYKPSSNGLVERANKSILAILKTVITPNTADWHLVLDDVQMTLNNSVNESVGESPHFLLYGYDGRMPHFLLDDAVPLRPTYNYEDYVRYRTKRSYDIVRKVRDILGRTTQSRKVRFDQNATQPVVQLGQKVFVSKHVKEGPLFKVSPKFEGPYRIIEILKFNKYRLRNVGDGTERIAHWNHLKLIRDDIDVSFLSKDFNVSNEPVSLQDHHHANNMDITYNLRSREVHKL